MNNYNNKELGSESINRNDQDCDRKQFRDQNEDQNQDILGNMGNPNELKPIPDNISLNISKNDSQNQSPNQSITDNNDNDEFNGGNININLNDSAQPLRNSKIEINSIDNEMIKLKKASFDYQIKSIEECEESNNFSSADVDRKVEHSNEFIILVTWFLITTQGFDKFDQGALPAMMKYSIKNQDEMECPQCMGFGEEWTAYINSISKLGLVVGCLIVNETFKLCKPKVLMSLSSVFTAIFFTLFSVFSYNIMTEQQGWTLDTRWWILVIARFFIGVMQAFTQIQPQVFMSLQLPAATKTFQVSMMAATIPVGILAGYGLTALVFQDHQQLAILFQAGFQFFFTVMFLQIPDSVDLTQDNLLAAQKDKVINVETRVDDTFCQKLYLNFKAYQDNIFGIPEYYLNTIAMCAVQFLVTTIQFQSPFYIEIIMPEVSKIMIDIAQLVNSVFVLSLGVVMGGKMTNYFGGIRMLSTVRFMVFLLAVAVVTGLVFSFSEDFTVFAIFMGITLFFGSAWLPISMTMNLEYLQPEYKTAGHSAFILFTNLFGFFPPNIVFGQLSVFQGYKTALISCISVGAIGFICMIILQIKRSNASNEENLNGEQQNI